MYTRRYLMSFLVTKALNDKYMFGKDCHKLKNIVENDRYYRYAVFQ